LNYCIDIFEPGNPKFESNLISLNEIFFPWSFFLENTFGAKPFRRDKVGKVMTVEYKGRYLETGLLSPMANFYIDGIYSVSTNACRIVGWYKGFENATLQGIFTDSNNQLKRVFFERRARADIGEKENFGFELELEFGDSSFLDIYVLDSKESFNYIGRVFQDLSYNNVQAAELWKLKAMPSFAESAEIEKITKFKYDIKRFKEGVEGWIYSEDSSLVPTGIYLKQSQDVYFQRPKILRLDLSSLVSGSNLYHGFSFYSSVTTGTEVKFLVEVNDDKVFALDFE
jgi:hypothetical protein